MYIKKNFVIFMIFIESALILLLRFSFFITVQIFEVDGSYHGFRGFFGVGKRDNRTFYHLLDLFPYIQRLIP